jgi:hypothetical protein
MSFQISNIIEGFTTNTHTLENNPISNFKLFFLLFSLSISSIYHNENACALHQPQIIIRRAKINTEKNRIDTFDLIIEYIF